jgi:hypothetical protein
MHAMRSASLLLTCLLEQIDVFLGELVSCWCFVCGWTKEKTDSDQTHGNDDPKSPQDEKTQSVVRVEHPLEAIVIEREASPVRSRHESHEPGVVYPGSESEDDEFVLLPKSEEGEGWHDSCD